MSYIKTRVKTHNDSDDYFFSYQQDSFFLFVISSCDGLQYSVGTELRHDLQIFQHESLANLGH